MASSLLGDAFHFLLAVCILWSAELFDPFHYRSSIRCPACCLRTSDGTLPLSSFSASPKALILEPPFSLFKDDGRTNSEARMMSRIVYFVLRLAFLCVGINASSMKSLIIGSDACIAVRDDFPFSLKVRLASSADILTRRRSGRGGYCAGVEPVVV